MAPVLLHQLLEVAAQSQPASTAFVDGVRSLTYGELDGRADQVARTLVEEGVMPGDRVGLYLDKSAEAVVGLFGVLKAGACYVPLDPGAPAARLGYIAGDCGLRCLITGTEKADRWAELIGAGAPVETLVVLGEAGGPASRTGPPGVRMVASAEVASRPAAPVAMPVIDEDLAYILYTSGSTGQPKGVMLTHRNALAFVSWAARRFELRSTDRLSSHAPLQFDLSVFDIFAAAAVGATVVLVPPRASVLPGELARFIAHQAITVWYSVPSILSMLSLRGGLGPGALPNLATVLFAGEVFPTGYLRRLMHQLPHARFHNLFGPTETNVCTHYEVPSPPEDDAGAIPIGRAIDNVEVFAVTGDGRLAAPGEEGELYVRGATVMAGYWGDAARSRAALVGHPLGRPPPGATVYRTGDLVCLGDDGEYRFLGRRDAQLKCRGYRIEPGDVEAAIHVHGGVVECAVIGVPDALVGNRLRAYVAAEAGVDGADLRRFAAARLPAYMVPDAVEVLAQLPRTPTGKIDRQALRRRAEGDPHEN